MSALDLRIRGPVGSIADGSIADLVAALRTVPEVIEVSRPYPNRRGSGHRVYVRVGAVRMPVAAPLAQAEDAKGRRDAAGEVDALLSADQELRSQPWFPIRPGDVVLLWLAPTGDMTDGYGQTFVALDDPDEVDEAGALLREVATTDPDSLELYPVSFYDLWFEAGPRALVVIRAGQVVHGIPVRARLGGAR